MLEGSGMIAVYCCKHNRHVHVVNSGIRKTKKLRSDNKQLEQLCCSSKCATVVPEDSFTVANFDQCYTVVSDDDIF
jgi:hypothetical protein